MTSLTIEDIDKIRNMSSQDYAKFVAENIQEGEVSPLIDQAKHFIMPIDAIEYVHKSKGIASFQFGIHPDPMYIMSEQAYKYMLSKCSSDEAWDLGILGQSEQHVKVVEKPTIHQSLLPKRKPKY